MKWIEGAKKEDFPQEPYHELIDLIGLEKTIEVAQRFRKQSIYFGNIDRIEGQLKRRYIIERFAVLVREMDPPRVYTHLARETGFAVPTVYDIVRNDDNKKRQMRLNLGPEKDLKP